MKISNYMEGRAMKLTKVFLLTALLLGFAFTSLIPKAHAADKIQIPEQYVAQFADQLAGQYAEQYEKQVEQSVNTFKLKAEEIFNSYQD